MNDLTPRSTPPLTPGRVSDLLSRAGLSPQRGEAQAVIARLAAAGIAEPGSADAVAALEAIRATDDSDVALAALHQHATAAGLPPESAELRPLLRAVGPAPEPAVLRAALLGLRRASWPRRIGLLAAGGGGLPWRRVDQEQAAASLTDPAADDAALLAALEAAVADRLRAAGSPDAALSLAQADLATRLGKDPAMDDFADCVACVATAFRLTDASSWIAEITGAERTRRREARAAEREAREARAAEEQRQRDWEQSLVAAEALPALLGCTAVEAARWVRAGLIPAARKVTLRRGPKTVHRTEFDPLAVAALRPGLPGWRAAEAHSGRHHPAPTAPAPTARFTPSQNAAVARVAALDRYAAHFTTARALNRRIVLITGPTNSGKTHMALDRLAAADSGLALAPLRLLAHEFREALAARGIPTSLTTGEERDLVPGARHIAATVEMCPFQTPVDVAVIDEAQMLDDADRGAAWTAAIMGVPARTVIVLGAPDCAAMVHRVAALCADPVEEIHLERKSPLAAAPHPVKLADLGRGDALIAFSRREVLSLRAALMARGRSVACVYGALSPEVRRAEASRFREGQADILVATDAIGMGLNFGPLRRVVFSALSKWDGREQRALSVQDIKQIGGRAGRFGYQDEGLVAVLAGAGEPATIAKALAATPAPPTDLRPRVAPDADIVAAVAAEIGTDSLYATLIRITRAVLRADDPNYRLADLAPHTAIAGAIDRLSLPLLARWTYALCPINIRDRGVERLAAWALEHAAGRRIRPPTAGRLPPPDRAGQEEQERAEKIYRRLVSWRWLAMGFPEPYADQDEALAEGERLNGWIEAVLAGRPRSK
ncbi:MAG TPA: helicase-related protein [Acetobacteraceae bacterium]|nr:helicase-related protein [Acetobacteraceae bacterium]